MKFKLNPSASLPIPCPHCGKKSDQLVSRLRQNPEIACVSCGNAFTVDGKELEQLVKVLESFGR